MSTYEFCTLATWAATIPMILYAIVRKLYDLLAVVVILFGMLSLPVCLMIERPNPDAVKVMQVVVP